MKTVATLLCLALSALADPAPTERVHCNLAVLTRAERERDHQLVPLLRDALQERQELSDGYAYRFTPGVLKDLGEWVAIVAKCCQPLSYEVTISRSRAARCGSASPGTRPKNSSTPSSPH